jgi:imidazoleglycerol phosphate dehydratase HisB
VEATFKALGLALEQAMAEGGSVFSTKGAVLLEATD